MAKTPWWERPIVAQPAMYKDIRLITQPTERLPLFAQAANRASERSMISRFRSMFQPRQLGEN